MMRMARHACKIEEESESKVEKLVKEEDTDQRSGLTSARLESGGDSTAFFSKDDKGPPFSFGWADCGLAGGGFCPSEEGV